MCNWWRFLTVGFNGSTTSLAAATATARCDQISAKKILRPFGFLTTVEACDVESAIAYILPTDIYSRVDVGDTVV
jgi:hypothetical protein